MPAEPSVYDRIQELMAAFTDRERRVAQTLLANYPVAGLETVSRLAGTAGVSTATVLRFVNKLGFALYSDFQAALRSQLTETLQSPLTRMAAARDRADAQASFLHRFTEAVTANARSMLDTLPASEFEATVELLCDTRRQIHVLGGRYSSSVGRYLVDFLKALRPRVGYIDGQTQKWPNHLLDFDRNTVLIVFDTRRYQSDVGAFARLAAERGCQIVLFTDIWHSDIARVAHRVLAFPVTVPSIFDSVAVGFIMAEALVGACAEKLGERSRTRIEDLEAFRMPLAPRGPEE